ncbi:hypothetical protein ABW17_08190 [Mycobacterium nebraskense]|uniref:methyltransferase family protein n=1 Tax=Mycobacterium nebraskense TaxID=244292 RepID=UPI0006421730|nr:isoprenylcysteine carboxylmethyltransferase family protein [Mycobacterium nebraskense]KLO44662.1 hypothetical protein ABW17_08190 [Mycobacterium nebraskense]
MAIAALALFAAMMLLMGALRTLIQCRCTGESGNRRTLLPDGSLEWWALIVADVGYLMVGAGAPLAALAGMSPLGVVDPPMLRGLGVVLAVLGMLAAFAAQLSLGASWRVGIDEAERTGLVTTGAFRIVRNPIFSAVLLAFAGPALMVPNLVAIAGLVVAVTGVQLQVRLVEEPHLHRVHGHAYTD